MVSLFQKQNSPVVPPNSNIFANRSGLLLHELLTHPEEEFQLRELARRLEISHGLVQRVISQLVYSGIMKSDGIRTAKKYRLIKAEELLTQWTSSYNITKKCKFYNYACGYSATEVKEKLRDIKSPKPVFALHSAARNYSYSFTNLNDIELYLTSPSQRKSLEEILKLKPIERGYDVLLIEPYYKSILQFSSQQTGDVLSSSPLLTFLDLYHFPIRGHEQAEHLLRKHPILHNLVNLLKKERNGR